MKIVKGRLIQRIKRTPSVESFRFILNEKVDFSPGHFLQVIFDDKNPGNKELNKYLSFSSSPTKEYIEVTKRLSQSNFSQGLAGLRLNDEISFKAPLGNCVFKDDYKKIGFLIGGIGITPVISIVEYVIDKSLDTDIELFYSNRSEDEIAFRKELDLWKDIKSNIKIIYTVTECPPKDERCIFGFIDKDNFLGKVTYLDERIFFIFGPLKMVEAMKDLCIGAGGREENIKTEIFIGY